MTELAHTSDTNERTNIPEMSGPKIPTSSFTLEPTGNNGVFTVSDVGVEGVSLMRIVFNGSGAVAGVVPRKDRQGLFVITLATGTIRALTAESSHDNFPAWSPKGDRIAFTRFTESDYELYTIKPDGSDVRRLTNERGNDAHCAWSPDGEWLAFSSARGGFKDEAALDPGNPQPYADIYVMRADGSVGASASMMSD